MKTYITFGGIHQHVVNGVVFDKDCVAVIEHEKLGEGRKIAFEVFGRNFCFEYPEKHFDMKIMRHFPRGFVKLELEKALA